MRDDDRAGSAPLRTAPHTDPVEIYRVRDGIYAADMLLTAIVHLDPFSRLEENPSTTDGPLPRIRNTIRARPT